MSGKAAEREEPRDQGTARPRPPASEPARILIVGGDPDTRSTLVKLLRKRRHRCADVSRLADARAALAECPHDLILLNPELPDGDGLDLVRRHQKTPTKTIVFSETRSFRIALGALRCGAIDFIRTPVDLDEFADRVDSALRQSFAERQREERIQRLHHICRELSDAKADVSEQIESLVDDLATAYRELADQVEDVTMATEFRTLLHQELDLEEVLRTTLEYLLARTGPTNAAVFLPDPDQRYSLGAYVNYDCPRESIDRLLDPLCDAICPQMADEPDLVAFDDADEFAAWVGAEGGLLSGSQVIAFSCRHEGECLAVIVLFRSATTPFDPHLAGTLDILRAIFAEQLSTIVRIHHRAMPDWPDDGPTGDRDYDDEDWYGFGGAAA